MLTLIKNIILLGFIAFAVSSCSTMSKSECLTADWRTIGYGDGTRGYKASRISQHRSACADHGVRPDLNAYNTGRAEGLKQYCRPVTGYNKGLSGYRYNGVCAGNNEREFVDALNYGLTIYSATKTLKNLKSDYSTQEDHIAYLEKRLNIKEEQLISGRLSKVKALILLNETKEMAEDLGKAKRDLESIGIEISKQSQHVNYLRGDRNYQ